MGVSMNEGVCVFVNVLNSAGQEVASSGAGHGPSPWVVVAAVSVAFQRSFWPELNFLFSFDSGCFFASFQGISKFDCFWRSRI